MNQPCSIPDKKYLIAASSIVLLVVLSFVRTYPGYFLSDDYNMLWTVSRHTYSELFLPSVGNEFLSNFYRPLALVISKLQFSLFGMNPAGYWITNVLLHAANSLLLGLLVFRLMGKFWEATVAGLIFAVYPIHTEPVLWFCAKFDLMSTFFILLSIILYMEYSNGRRRMWIYSLSLASMLFAMLSKEIGLLTPFLLVLCKVFWGTSDEPKMKRYARIIPFFALGAAYFLFTFVVFHGFMGYRHGSRSIHLPYDPTTPIQDYLYAFYRDFSLLLVPCCYEEFIANSWHLWTLGGIYVSLLIMLLLKGRAPLKALSFGLLWVTLMIMPIFMSPMSLNLMRARYYYLPSIGIAIFLGFMFSMPAGRAFNFRWVNTVLAITFLCVFSAIIYKNEIPWIQAANLSRWFPLQIGMQLPDSIIKGSQVYIINLPDSLRGAIVYRNGIEEAVNFLYNTQGEKIVKVFSLSDDGYLGTDYSRNIIIELRQQKKKIEGVYLFKYEWMGNGVGRLVKLYPQE